MLPNALHERTSVFRQDFDTLNLPARQASVDSAWEQKKLEVGKMSLEAADSHAARLAGDLAPSMMMVKKRHYGQLTNSFAHLGLGNPQQNNLKLTLLYNGWKC
jgi:hypothetical protein